MIRYTLFVLAVVGSAATALASISPSTDVGIATSNVTVLHKNQAWPMQGLLIVEACGVADCSDTPAS